jgi:hypothetical protein
MEYTSAQMGLHTDTQAQQEERFVTVGYKSMSKGPLTKRLELQKRKHSSFQQTTIFKHVMMTILVETFSVM